MAFLHTTKGETSSRSHFYSTLDGAQWTEDLVELGSDFHFWCLHVSWWFSFWKRGPIFNIHQLMPSVRTP